MKDSGKNLLSVLLMLGILLLPTCLLLLVMTRESLQQSADATAELEGLDFLGPAIQFLESESSSLDQTTLELETTLSLRRKLDLYAHQLKLDPLSMTKRHFEYSSPLALMKILSTAAPEGDGLDRRQLLREGFTGLVAYVGQSSRMNLDPNTDINALAQAFSLQLPRLNFKLSSATAHLSATDILTLERELHDLEAAMRQALGPEQEVSSEEKNREEKDREDNSRWNGPAGFGGRFDQAAKRLEKYRACVEAGVETVCDLLPLRDEIRRLWERVHVELVDRVKERYQQIVAKRQEIQAMTVACWILVSFFVVVYWRKDHAHRRQLESKQREIARRQSRLQSILNSASDAILTIDSQYQMIDCNFSAEKVFDLRAKDSGAGYASVFSLIGKSKQREFESFLADKFARTSTNSGDSREWPMVGRSGQPLTVEVTTSYDPVTDPHILTLFIRDVTVHKEQQRQIYIHQSELMQSSRLSALGVVSANIAHEINNPLSLITGLASQVQRSLEKNREFDQRVKDDVKKIESTAFKIAKIVAGLKLLSKKGDSGPFSAFSARSIVDDVKAVMDAKLQDMNVDFYCGSVEEIMCLGRPVQVAQVVMNLLSNAVDAVSEQTEGERWVEIATEDRESTVWITVTDSGKGIPDEVAGKIMDPFFTTKSAEKGTGLGLSISFAIAREHGGKLFLNRDSVKTQFVLEIKKANGNKSAA